MQYFEGFFSDFLFLMISYFSSFNSAYIPYGYLILYTITMQTYLEGFVFYWGGREQLFAVKTL